MDREFKMYEVIIEYGETVYKSYNMHKNERDAKKFVEGNGDVVRIKDATDKFPISSDKVFKALRNADFGQVEASAICSFLINNYKNTTI